MRLAIVTAYPPSKVTLTEYGYHLVKHFRLQKEVTLNHKELTEKYFRLGCTERGEWFG